MMKKLIGLTGKTGAGKSTVSKYLQEKGAYIIDGDVVARQVLEDDKNLLLRLSEAFGGVLNEDGSLNRKLLASKAFCDEESTKLLNSIIHPAINDVMEKESQEAFKTYDVVVVDAAAIIESGYSDKCDALYVVHAPFEVRKERIINRDNLSERDALIRMNGQKDDDFYLSRADKVINAYPPHSLQEQLDSIEKELFH